MPAAVASRAVPALEVEDLRKTYSSGVQALKGVSLRVAQGDFFALLGPNGAGKTTTFYLITGLIRPDAGRIWLDDLDITRYVIGECVAELLGDEPANLVVAA